jgi:hypothetical protein
MSGMRVKHCSALMKPWEDLVLVRVETSARANPALDNHF